MGRIHTIAISVALPLAAATVATFVALRAFDHPYVGMDDANIFMAYAESLASGQGFAYNAGGEPQEGFTSLLYTLLMAAIWALASEPEGALLLLNVLLAAAAVGLAARTVMRVASDGPGAGALGVVVVVWAFASPAFATWTSVALMDGALWCLAWCALAALCTVEVSAVAGSSARLAAGVLLAAALPAVRPEGMAVAAALPASFLLGARLRGANGSRALGAALPSALAWAAALAGLTAWRLLVFGQPLPNTYYAKVSPDRVHNLVEGVAYLYDFLAAHPLAGLAAGAALAGVVLNLAFALGVVNGSGSAAAGAGERARAVSLTLSVLVLGGLAVPVLTGGDHFGQFRFYQPLWPLMILPPIALGLEFAERRGSEVGARPRLAWAAACVLAPALVVSAPVPWTRFQKSSRLDKEFAIAEAGRREGEALNRAHPGWRPSVGVITAGGIAVAYEGEVVDLMGLNLAAMARAAGDRRGPKNHAAFQPEVFFELRPDVVWPRYVRSDDPAAALLDFVSGVRPVDRYMQDKVLRGLLADPRFRETWVPAAILGRPAAPLVPDPFFFVPEGRRHRPQPDDLGGRVEVLMGYFQRDQVARLQSEGADVLALSWRESR